MNTTEPSQNTTKNEFTTAPTSHDVDYEFVTLHEKPFPANILSFRTYGGMKVFALLVFLWMSSSFVCTLYDVTFDQAKFKQYATVEIENRGLIKKVWHWGWEFFWQDTPRKQQIEINTQKNINNAILWALLKLALAWCILWLCFDWRNAKNLVFAAFSIGMGIAYSLLPIDAIPDFIPAVGQIDDICANLFGSGIGIASIAEYVRKRRQREMITRLIRDNPQAALDLALEDYGILVKKIGTQGSKNNL
jgi:uncharacterized membrane protein YkvA (DUF1232 family)